MPPLKDKLQKWPQLGSVEPGLKVKAGPEYKWPVGKELTPPPKNETLQAQDPEMARLTSYFWRFSFSPNSNLSVSSWYRVSQSSLALSLEDGKEEV